MLVASCATQLERSSSQFDVMVTTNMFADILSDEAAAVMASLRMAPSALLSAGDESGRQRALYEPRAWQRAGHNGNGYRQSAWGNLESGDGNA